MLWDLSTDYYLHHADPRLGRKRRSYTQWWTPKNLEPRKLPQEPHLPPELADKPIHYFDDYWLEYYRPKAVSSFLKVFTYKLNSTLRYIPVKMTKDGKYDLSPFVVRGAQQQPQGEETTTAKGKKKIKPRKGIIEFPGFREKAEVEEQDREKKKPAALRQWLPAAEAQAAEQPPVPQQSEREEAKQARDITVAVERSLNPQISEKERAEYTRYMSHPLLLPLVVSTEPSERELQGEVVREFVKYVKVPQGDVEVAEEDIRVYDEAVRVPENPLDVGPEDGGKRRYVAYGIWVSTGKLKRGRRGEEA
jgi:hypothetical protein